MTRRFLMNTLVALPIAGALPLAMAIPDAVAPVDPIFSLIEAYRVAAKIVAAAASELFCVGKKC